MIATLLVFGDLEDLGDGVHGEQNEGSAKGGGKDGQGLNGAAGGKGTEEDGGDAGADGDGDEAEDGVLFPASVGRGVEPEGDEADEENGAVEQALREGEKEGDEHEKQRGGVHPAGHFGWVFESADGAGVAVPVGVVGCGAAVEKDVDVEELQDVVGSVHGAGQESAEEVSAGEEEKVVVEAEVDEEVADFAEHHGVVCVVRTF